jgi:hypothetical protein
MVRNNAMAGWIDRFIRRTQGIQRQPIPFVPRQNLRMLIIISSDYSADSEKFCKFFINNGFVSKNIDVHKSNEIEDANLPNLMQRFYNTGYRLFITTHSSSKFESLFNWLNSRPDVIYINSGSTVANENFLESIPSNSFRTSINDLNSLRALLYDILPNLKFSLITNGNTQLYSPLINTIENDMPFKYIVYIYEPSLYTNSYRDNIQTLINNYSFSKEVIFVPIELDPNTNTLPDDAVYYLTFNNISNKEFLTSAERPIIILNSLNPQSVFDRFTEEIYYDNYFVTGDPFIFQSYTTKFEFKYAFTLISAFNPIGYKLSYNIDRSQSVSTHVLMIYGICSQIGPLFNENISQNKTFISSQLLQKLKTFNYIKNNQWYDEYLTLQHISYENDFHSSEENEPHFTTYDLAILKHKWNPDMVVIAVSTDYTLSYDQMTFTEPLLTYSQNLIRMNLVKPNAYQPISNNEYDLFHLADDFNKFRSFLMENYSRDLPEKLFAKYYWFNATQQYSIPVININLPPITGYVIQNVYNLEIIENTIDSSLNLTIPAFSYDRVSLFYNKTRGMYDQAKQTTLPRVSIPSFNVVLTDSVKEFDLYFYNGNMAKIYKSQTNFFGQTTFELIQSLISYVKVHVTVNWLVIKKKYTIGERATKISTNRKTLIKDISSDLFNLTIQYSDDNSIETVTQDDIAPTSLLDEFNNPIVPLEN